MKESQGQNRTGEIPPSGIVGGLAESSCSTGAGLRSIGKSMELPPDPTVTCAPHFYPDRLHAIAISPDGSVIAYGVPPLRNDQGFAIPRTARIYIVNAVTLRIERQIEGIASRAQDLKFSSDGEYLGAALSSGCGIRVWRTLDWTLYASDDTGYAGLKGPDKACGTGSKGGQDVLPDTLSLAFAGTGPVWLVSSGMSGVRTYAKGSGALSPLRFVRPEKLGLEVPDGLAISPGGKYVAIGDRQLRSPRGISGYGVVVADLESMGPSPLRLPGRPPGAQAGECFTGDG